MQNSPQTFMRPVNAIPSAAQAAGSVNGAKFDRLGFDQAAVILSLGALGASGTVDIKLQESDTLAGTYADIAGAAFTQKTQAGTDMTNLIYLGSVDLRGRKRFLRVVSAVGTATCQVAVVVILYDAQSTGYVTAAQHASEANTAQSADFAV